MPTEIRLSRFASDNISHSPESVSLNLQDFAHGFGNIFVFTSNQARAISTIVTSLPKRHTSERIPTQHNFRDNDEMLRQEVDIHHREFVRNDASLSPGLGERGAPATLMKTLSAAGFHHH